MKIPSKILEVPGILEYLQKRGLLEQYKKAAHYLLSGYTKQIDFKMRKPTSDKIRYFRINRKYRVFGFWDIDMFIVMKISDHQE